MKIAIPNSNILITGAKYFVDKFKGYILSFSEENIDVDIIEEDTNLSYLRSPVMIDETVNNGNTINKFLEMWSQLNAPPIQEGYFLFNPQGHRTYNGLKVLPLARD